MLVNARGKAVNAANRRNERERNFCLEQVKQVCGRNRHCVSIAVRSARNKFIITTGCFVARDVSWFSNYSPKTTCCPTINWNRTPVRSKKRKKTTAGNFWRFLKSGKPYLRLLDQALFASRFTFLKSIAARAYGCWKTSTNWTRA